MAKASLSCTAQQVTFPVSWSAQSAGCAWLQTLDGNSIRVREDREDAAIQRNSPSSPFRARSSGPSRGVKVCCCMCTICIQIYIYIYMHIHKILCIYTYLFVHVYVLHLLLITHVVCLYAYPMCVCVCSYIHFCTHVIRVSACVHARACVRACVSVCIYLWSVCSLFYLSSGIWLA